PETESEACVAVGPAGCAAVVGPAWVAVVGLGPTVSAPQAATTPAAAAMADRRRNWRRSSCFGSTGLPPMRAERLPRIRRSRDRIRRRCLWRGDRPGRPY